MNFKTDKTQLLAALFALTMMPMTMTACGGPTCGSGTTENDSGECVPEADAVTCADGTTLSEGTCVLDTTGCGTNTVLQGGVCVPAETLCANGTTFNTTTSECEAAQECGAGTAANDAGECVPAAGACAAGTTLNGDGICEVATAACGAGTQLDAATGTCALTDAVCGDNTVLANGSCTIIADACTTGTVFNDGTGTCTPEATCKPGDAISGGLCVTPADVLFEMATVEVTGNTNPEIDGTPLDVTLPAAGTPLVIKGTIDAAFDHDSDPATPDVQDIDFVKITATGAQLIKVTVQPTNASSIPLVTGVIADIDGLDYDRTAPAIGSVSSRFVMLPVAGDYLVPVLPRGFTGDAYIGSDDYDYVLSIEDVAIPTPALASAGIQGEFSDLSDNFYDLDMFSSADILDLSFEELGSGASDYTLHFFDNASGSLVYQRTESIPSGDTPVSSSSLVSSDDTVVLLDWDGAKGTDFAYRGTAAASTNIEALGVIAADAEVFGTALASLDAGGSFWYSFSVDPGQIITIGLDNDEEDSAQVTLYDASGGVVSAGRVTPESFFSAEFFNAYSAAGGSYLVRLDGGNFGAITNAVISVSSNTPKATLTPIAGDAAQVIGGPLTEGTSDIVLLDLATALEITGTINSIAGDIDYTIVDVATGDIVNSGARFGDETIDTELPAGLYFIDLLAYDPTDDYTMDLTFRDAPATEVEPNETDATATPFSLNSRGASGTFADAADVDVYSFTVAADQAPEDILVLRLDPDVAAGATPTYSCDVRDSSGTLVSQANVVNECVLMLKGLVTTETYTVDLRTDSATPIDYELTLDRTTGEIEDPASAGVINVGSLPLAGSIDFFGDLATDGVNTTVDAISFKIDSIDAGQLLVVEVVPVYNRAVAPGLTAEITDTVPNQIAFLDTAPLKFTLDTVTAGFYTLNLSRADIDPSLTLRYKVSMEIVSKVIVNSTPGTSISNANPTATIDTLNVGEACVIADILIPVDITHTWRGDLELDLTSPAGTTVRLQDNIGSSADDVLGVFGDDLAVDGDLSDFFGESATGVWTFTATDTGGGDDGTLNSWGVEISCQ